MSDMYCNPNNPEQFNHLPFLFWVDCVLNVRGIIMGHVSNPIHLTYIILPTGRWAAHPTVVPRTISPNCQLYFLSGYEELHCLK